MANVDIIIKMIDKTGAAKNSTTANLKSMATTLATVAAAAIAVGYAMKKAFELGKEGAMLEFTATKFDRLAQSIGTTSDALMNDLRKATGGIYSDMELMASATDFVALGLANTHDEAIRLAAVSGGLNMNMNQLVLTLTNMTTMRFDALGVRVDGFKDKVKALEDQGYSTNDAFKEAFLQQAEDQLKLVGNAADTTLGSYMRLEAAVKNSTDAMKRQTSEGLEPLVKWLSNQIEAENRIREALEATNKSLYGQWSATRQLTPAMKEAIDAYWAAQDAIEGQTGAIEKNIQSLEDAEKAMQALQTANYDLVTSMLDITKTGENFRDGQADINKKLAALYEERNGLYSWEKDAIQKNEDAVAELTDKFRDNEEEYKKNWVERMGLMAIEAIAISDGVKGFSDAEQAKAIAYLQASGLMVGGAQEQAIAEQMLIDAIAKAAEEDIPYWGEVMKRIMDDGVVQINEVTDAINNVPSERTIKFNVIMSQADLIPIIDPRRGRGFNQHASGGDFMIPMSYGNEGFRMGNGDTASGGERVSITPKGQTPNQPMIDYRKMGKAIVQALAQAGG